MRHAGNHWTRRELLGAAVGGAAALLAAPARGGTMTQRQKSERLPTIFIAHGLDDLRRGRELLQLLGAAGRKADGQAHVLVERIRRVDESLAVESAMFNQLPCLGV